MLVFGVLVFHTNCIPLKILSISETFRINRCLRSGGSNGKNRNKDEGNVFVPGFLGAKAEKPAQVYAKFKDGQCSQSVC